MHVVNKLEQCLDDLKREFWHEGTPITGLFEWLHIDRLRWLLERNLDGEDQPFGLTKSLVELIKGWDQSPHYIIDHALMDSASFGDSAIFKPSGLSSSE